LLALKSGREDALIIRGRFINPISWLAAAIALAVLGGGCISMQDKIDATKAVSRVFCEQYESIISEHGTRIVRVSRGDAYTGMRATLASLGMQLEDQNPKLGLFSVSGPAPLPLDAAEWDKASEADLPLLRQIAKPHIGWLATYFLRFEPEGVRVVITATVTEVAEGSSISLTVRLRELKPPPSGFPRRECLAPSAVRAGLDKIWVVFDRELLGVTTKS
jgi:hypothetical protein